MEASKKESVKKEAVKKEVSKPIVKAIAVKKEEFENSKCKDHNICAISKYVETRLEDLEDQEEAALNPLDRLEIRARIDELHELIHTMEHRAIKGLIKELFESNSK